MVHQIKCVPYKRKDPSSIPQSPSDNQANVVATCNPEVWEADILGASWLVTLSKLVSLQFSERPCLYK